MSKESIKKCLWNIAKITKFLTTCFDHCYMYMCKQLVLSCNLIVWRKNPKWRTLHELFLQSLDLAEKHLNLEHMRSHKHFIPSKFREHPSCCSIVKADYVFPYLKCLSLTPSIIKIEISITIVILQAFNSLI